MACQNTKVLEEEPLGRCLDLGEIPKAMRRRTRDRRASERPRPRGRSGATILTDGGRATAPTAATSEAVVTLTETHF